LLSGVVGLGTGNRDEEGDSGSGVDIEDPISVDAKAAGSVCTADVSDTLVSLRKTSSWRSNIGSLPFESRVLDDLASVEHVSINVSALHTSPSHSLCVSSSAPLLPTIKDAVQQATKPPVNQPIAYPLESNKQSETK
jgi:hypothetical protein